MFLPAARYYRPVQAAGPTTVASHRMADGVTATENRRRARPRCRRIPNHAPDDVGRLPASAELHQLCELLAPPALAHGHLVARVLPAYRPGAGAGQISSRLFRRPAL